MKARRNTRKADPVATSAEVQWLKVIDRRGREIEQGRVSCRSVEQTVQNIRKKLQRESHARIA